MTKPILVVGATAFMIGAGVGSLLTYTLTTPDRSAHPLAMTAEEREVAQAQVDLLKASVLLRGLAQACIAMHHNTEGWTLPASASDLIDELVAEDMISRELYDAWPGAEQRPVGEPPFYIVGTTEDLANRDGDAALFYEHPAHHPERGGSIVYADTDAETLGPTEFAEAIAALAPD